MAGSTDSFDDLVITFAPDATPEEEERFLDELAHAIIAVARHLVAAEEKSADEGNADSENPC